MHEYLGKRLKHFFLAGLLIVVPLGLTMLSVRWVIGFLDGLLVRLLPVALRPEALFGFPVPGLGLLATFLLIVLVGMLATNYFVKALLNRSENLMGRIPLVKGIYSLFKQVTDTVLNAERQSFRKVVLIEYPRRGVWSLGFVTGTSEGEVQRLTAQRMINVFMPTTPNPTSGFYILVPEEDARVLNMTVEEAFKLIVSGGMVTPPDRFPSLTAIKQEGRPANNNDQA
ncbi:DUF502 domain-containing protein [Desulfuromonas sp. CSMB_57]|jgi:uncharacterized membrane protein|uniref:DUF502 domain-containing protein n=1 Tax=Desulfuromonas sp. CSMB_57 TaxID=2807629 RepID=UPI001CD1E173|nr:DUF502 domain-containing protein [Desulfuromonas sp. CSMB_57]